MNKLNAVEITVVRELNLNVSCVTTILKQSIHSKGENKIFCLPLQGNSLWRVSGIGTSASMMTASCCRTHCLVPVMLSSLSAVLAFVIAKAGYHHATCLIAPYQCQLHSALWPFPVLMFLSWQQLRSSLCQAVFFFVLWWRTKHDVAQPSSLLLWSAQWMTLNLSEV